MKVRKRKDLCWEHGPTWHLLSGTEDDVLDSGLCARCLVDFWPDPAVRREVVRHYRDTAVQA